MTKEEMITAMAKLIAGLQVPMSMSMPLGAAKDPWVKLHRELHGFGWATAEDYENAIKAVLRVNPGAPGEHALDGEAGQAGRDDGERVLTAVPAHDGSDNEENERGNTEHG